MSENDGIAYTRVYMDGEPSVFLSVSHYEAVKEFLGAIERLTPYVVEDLKKLAPLYTKRVMQEFYECDHGGVDAEKWSVLCASCVQDCQQLRDDILAWANRYHLHDVEGRGLYEEIALKALDAYVRSVFMMASELNKVSLCNGVSLSSQLTSGYMEYIYPFVFAPSVRPNGAVEFEGLMDHTKYMASVLAEQDDKPRRQIQHDLQHELGWQGIAWNPRIESQDSFKTNMRNMFEQYLDDYMKRTLDESEAAGHNRQKPKKALYHFEWLVLFQIDGKTMGEIQRENNLGDNTANNGIEEAAGLCLLKLKSTSKGGRPPGSKNKPRN